MISNTLLQTTHAFYLPNKHEDRDEKKKIKQAKSKKRLMVHETLPLYLQS